MAFRLLVVTNFSIDEYSHTHSTVPDQSNFLSSLSKLGVDVGVACFIRKSIAPPYGIDIPKAVRIHSLGTWYANIGIIQKISCYVASLFRLRHIFSKYDLIYLYIPGWVSVIVGIAAVLVGKKTACYVRGGLDGEGPLIRYLYRLLCKQAKFAFCTGPAVLQQVRPLQANSFLVRPMIGVGIPDSLDARSASSADVLNLLYVGQLVESKGIFDFVEVIMILRAKGMRVRGVIVGNGDDVTVERLSGLVREHGLDGVVHLHGFIVDPVRLAAEYASAHILLFPSSYNEGFPRVILEAMLTGVAVVAYMQPYGDGLLRHAFNCLLVQPHDKKSLADQIIRLANEEYLFSEIVDQAFRDVKEYFSETLDLGHAEQVARLLRNDTIQM